MIKKRDNDKELFALCKDALYTPVICDILDELGFYNQFLPQEIHPLRLSDNLVGRAMTVVMSDVNGHSKNLLEN